jgi:hypothetical protein
MKNCLLIFAIFFFSVGCKRKNVVPSGVLVPQKMQAVLWDIMRTDQFLADYVLNKDTSLNKTIESLKYYQQIFAIHKISIEDFQNSFSFYKTHPVLLKTIMDSIATSPKDTLVKITKPFPIADTIITKPDTIATNSAKLLVDSSKFRKMRKQFIVN